MHWPLVIGLGALGIAAAGLGLSQHQAAPPAGRAGVSSFVPVDYAQHVRELDHWVGDLTARSQRDPRSWLGWESLANGYRERALFTGTTPDLARAETALAQAFLVAGPGAGPFFSRARLNASLHRFPRIEDDLRHAESEVPLDVQDRAGIAALRATVAFQCGRYAAAFSQWDAAMRAFPSPSVMFALADAESCTGNPQAAEDLIRRARSRTDPRDARLAAWLAVQHGIFLMEHGRLEEADTQYQDAERILPNWWFSAARRAELMVRRGDRESAIRLYTVLVQQTAKPELMDALAALLLQAGRAPEAASWSQIASLAYDDLLLTQPEAAFGHAIDHLLAVGTSPERTVDVAERNFHLRPGGEAAVKLAQAYLAAHRLPEAQATIAAVRATPYTTVALHRVAAAVYAANGEPTQAEAELRLARQIDPHA